MRSLSVSKFEDYHLAIAPLEAKELAMMFKASAYPDMKSGPKRKLIRDINKQMKENIERDDNKSHSTKEFAEMLTRSMT